MPYYFILDTVNRQTGRQTGRQTDRQADRQAGRQTGREIVDQDNFFAATVNDLQIFFLALL